MNQQPSSAREVAEELLDRIEVLSLHHLRLDAIESALKERDKRAAKITADIMPIGADDCYWCERVKQAVAAITKE